MENLLAGILALVGLTEICLLGYLISVPRRRRKEPSVLRLEKVNIFLALFFVMTLGAFFALNGPAYAESLSFSFRGGDEEMPGNDVSILHFATSTPAGTGNDTGTGIKPPAPGSAMVLSIPKLGVRTPIVVPTDTSTQGVLKSLEKGVGMYPGSVLPAQKGHMILLGHSSRASWYNGDYARVFALLKELKIGDEFTIEAGGKKYVYEIFSNQVFKPAATDAYLARPAHGSVVDLVTCDPVGSAANRRVVSGALKTSGQ